MDDTDVLKICKNPVPYIGGIMLTGRGSGETFGDGMRFGAYNYSIKPNDFEERVEKINAANSQRGQPTKGSVHDVREEYPGT